MQSDQGREFVNQINECLFQLTNIKHCVSSAYHPQTNGLDERLNQTLLGTLKKVTDSSKDNWDQFLLAALYAYRVSNQASSKYTPFFFMYNRHPRKAVTFEISQDVYCREESGGEEREDVDSDAVLEKLLEIRACTHKRAKENIVSAQAKQKAQYDAKCDTTKVIEVEEDIAAVAVYSVYNTKSN